MPRSKASSTVKSKSDLERKSDGGTAKQVEKELRRKIDKEKAAFFPKFFKSGPGEYAEGDKFLGVIVPDQRKIAKQFKSLATSEIEKLLDSDWHECRLTGVFILVHQFEKAKTEKEQKRLYSFYLRKIDRMNNWDLVDSSAHKIVGRYLLERDRKKLYQLARANHLWKNRVAMIATLWFIKHDDFSDTIDIAKILLRHPHDLIHKAVGWMLREMGKKQKSLLIGFLNEHCSQMPRTMLRYAIEKLPEMTRKKYLNSKKTN